MREKKSVGEQGRCRLASLLIAFRQGKKTLWTRSEGEDKVLQRIEYLMCILRKMSSIGRCGRSRRWRISQQSAELCMQGWMNDEYEPSLEDCQVWLTQRVKEREKTGVLHNITKSRPLREGFTNC